MGMLVFRSECYLCASVAGPRPHFSYTGPEAFQVTGNDTISKSRVLLAARVALHACLPACHPPAPAPPSSGVFPYITEGADAIGAAGHALILVLWMNL